MALSSLSVVANANRLRTYRRPALVTAVAPSRDVETTVEVREQELGEEEAMTTAEERATVKDPVCGMEIDPESAAAQMEYQGKTYYFCSHDCHEKFIAEPQKFAS